MFRWTAGILVGALLEFLAGSGQAELYVGGQVGASVPEKLTQVRGTNSSSGVQGSDLDLGNNVAFGVKVGYFLPRSWNWLGGEIEYYHRDSNIGEQPFTANGPLLGASGTGTIPRTGLAVNTIAWNAVVRYPGTVFQPYAGVGPGVTWALLRTSPRDTAVAPSLNIIAGARAFVTEHVALFAEYKHHRATFEFGDQNVEAKYRNNLFMIGVSYHFQERGR